MGIAISESVSVSTSICSCISICPSEEPFKGNLGIYGHSPLPPHELWVLKAPSVGSSLQMRSMRRCCLTWQQISGNTMGLLRGSKYPVLKDSGPENNTLNGIWDQSP